MVTLDWENCAKADGEYADIQRCKVPGGWLMKAESVSGTGGLTFVPDPNHSWN